ncbi:MAG: adenylate cyclase, class 2 [Parcubacteria group bacterium Gr01-1014_106]|nr:MAG: adenylate cyclase, class 2 [Parcubacteria group bacterium Gr01-1014_106]
MAFSVSPCYDRGHMREYEVRILEVDPQRIHDTLLQAGAQIMPKRTIRTQSYAFPDQSHAGDLWARLRLDPAESDGVTWELSLKHRATGEHTAAEEIALRVTDAEAAAAFLQRLGAVLRREITKERTTYLLNELRFDVEEFSLIPAYLEIEGPSHEAVEKGLTILGYTSADMFRGKSVFHHYGVDARPNVY